MTTQSPDALVLLWDANHAAEKIARFTAGRSFEDYLADDMMTAAVERQFEISGEALVVLRRAFPALAAEIRDLAQIIGFRNVLIHAYATIDDQLVWNVVQEDLPMLLSTLARLLSSSE